MHGQAGAWHLWERRRVEEDKGGWSTKARAGRTRKAYNRDVSLLELNRSVIGGGDGESCLSPRVSSALMAGLACRVCSLVVIVPKCELVPSE